MLSCREAMAFLPIAFGICACMGFGTMADQTTLPDVSIFYRRRATSDSRDLCGDIGRGPMY